MKTTHLSKRLLSLALAFVMLLGMLPLPQARAAGDETTLYLKPNDNWLKDGARFAMYYFGDSGDGWSGMEDPDEDGVYEGTVPDGYDNVIFCRMDPGKTELSWDSKWNQTADLTVPTDGTNCYTVEPGSWDKGNGSWSVYPEEGDDVPDLPPVEDDDEDDTLYIVAGAAALCGSEWNAADTANRMEKNESGLYEKVYYNVPAGTYSLKVTDGTWQNSWGDKGQNYTFVVSATCDVTVTFDPATYTVTVTGTGVGKETGLKVDSMVAVGNGSGAWLNGADWNPASALNAMTEVSSNVYEITYKNVPAGSNYQFKFAANGSWNHNWGAGSAAGEAAYNSSTNIKLVVEYDLADVTLRLDLTGYNHETKQGATYSVTVTKVVEEPEEPVVDYYLIGYINGANYGCEEDYENLGDYKFVDGKLTAKFDQDSYVFIKTGDNASWFMFESYVDATSGTLYNTTNGTSEKMRVPGGVELEFTLVVNDDGSLTLSYAEVVEEPEEPVVDYYMVGYINGANYGCEEDYENLGDYKFVDGKLTAKFDQDSYVFIKTGDNASWFMFESYVDATSGTLYNTTNGTSEKMRVPGGVELEFTLVVNDDGSLTLSYAEAADTNDVIIHFFKPEDWGDNVNGYLWITGGPIPGYEEYNAWPGKAIGANASHAGWYDLVVSTEAPLAFNFIFNDGGKQTSDLFTGDVTGDTELWVVGNTVSTTAPGEWSGDYDYTAHLHFQKPSGWADTVYAYLWTDGDAIPGYEEYNAWPGTTVVADAINQGWYNLSVTMDGNEGFNYIFSDGSGNQTADLVTGELEVNTHLWIMNGAASNTAPDGWKDPSRTVHVPGTFPGPAWDAASNTMSYNAELGLYVYTFEDVPAANYEYKIAINGSWNENYGAAGVRDGANIAVAVPETMDVTIYYNDDTHFSVTNLNYVFADVTLSGTGIPAGTKLTDKGLSGIYSVTVPMTAGTYTDLVITCNGAEYPFAEVEVKENKDVTFYMDPITEIYYCNASNVPVDTAAIYFDSQNTDYKKPFGAVATGEEVTFAIDTGKDVTAAVLVVKGLGSYPMTAEETETGKRWSTAVTIDSIGEYDYYFSLSNGSTVVIYGDDDGYYGEGTTAELSNVKAYDLVVYLDGFETPDWMKNAVIYQIFPDRFFDGNVHNNQAQTSARGAVNYEYIRDWYVLPENPEQEAMLDEAIYKATGAHFGDGEWSNEIYGGDLDGITQRIDYLKALGVNVIYLNPVFASISNHRYDACDYTEIDPILGTMGDFTELVDAAEKNDMHIILDGVFNHVSDDSVYFDRYYKFLGKSEKIGAYPYWAYVYDYMKENSADKQTAVEAARNHFSTEYGITDYSYTEWFEVYNTASASVDSIGLRAGKPVYSYDGWWGYDSMPIIYSTNGSEYQTGNWAEEIIYNTNDDSVTQYWISKGNNGWRLDVANEVSDETWQNFRESVKAMDSDAVIVGEIWDDATKYLKGDMYDSVMNYLFRNAVTSFAKGTNAADTTKQLEKIRERYPEEAFYAMMNLVGSHDTTRILSYLDGIGDDRADKSLEAAFPTYAKTSAVAKARQYLVAFLQFTYAGAPTIYYGDEIGMVGSDDPDDRRAMEWGRGNRELVEWYATLAAVRDAYPALRTGSVSPIDLKNGSLLAFVRADESNTVTVIANNSASAQTAALDGAYVDVLTGKTFDGSVTVPARNGLILVAEDEVKTISIHASDLAPAYDSAYTVAVRPEGEHVHSYDEVVVTAPTCTEVGYTTHTCICGRSYTDNETPALGHSFEMVEDRIVCASCDEELSLNISEEYIALDLTENKTAKMSVAVSPADVADDVVWTVEGNAVTVDETGLVTAANDGTAYILATISGEFMVSDRCRVDVSRYSWIQGVQLNNTKATTELYSTKYTNLEILLQLPQGFIPVADAQAEPLNNGIAIDSARFTDDTMAKLFSISVLDDRRVQIVPTDYAVENPKQVKSKYTGTITVTVQDKEYETNALTLTVKQTKPKVKATVAAFNSFYAGQSQSIVITGGTVTGIAFDASKTQPNWLDLEDTVLTLNENAPKKSASAKAYLLVETEEWRIPAAVTLSVKNSYKVPGVKLAASSVTVANLQKAAAVELQLLCTNKTDVLSDLNITGITAPEGYTVENFNAETGAFTLKAPNGFKSGKLTLKVAYGDITKSLTLTVKTQAVKLKLSASKITLNKDLKDTASVAVTVVTGGYAVAEPVLTFDDAKLDVRYSDGKLSVSLQDGAEYGKTYPVTVCAYEGAPAVKLSVAVVKQTAAVKSTIKASGTLDVIREGTAITVKPTYTNVANVDVDNSAVLKIYSSADKYKTVIAEVKAEDGIFVIDNTVISDQTLKYKAQLETELYADRDPVKSSMISLSVKMGTAKLTVMTSDTTLFANDKNDRALVWFEAKDAALNDVSRVEIKDAKYQDKFEVIDYGNGQFAIAFKDGVPENLIGKTVTLNLNVFIEGNQTAKANTTAKVKLTIVK